MSRLARINGVVFIIFGGWLEYSAYWDTRCAMNQVDEVGALTVGVGAEVVGCELLDFRP